MEFNEALNPENLAFWTMLLLFFMLLVKRGRYIIGWLLVKLYEFFIGDKDHVAPL